MLLITTSLDVERRPTLSEEEEEEEEEEEWTS